MPWPSRPLIRRVPAAAKFGQTICPLLLSTNAGTTGTTTAGTCKCHDQRGAQRGPAPTAANDSTARGRTAPDPGLWIVRVPLGAMHTRDRRLLAGRRPMTMTQLAPRSASLCSLEEPKGPIGDSQLGPTAVCGIIVGRQTEQKGQKGPPWPPPSRRAPVSSLLVLVSSVCVVCVISPSGPLSSRPTSYLPTRGVSCFIILLLLSYPLPSPSRSGVSVSSRLPSSHLSDSSCCFNCQALRRLRYPP